MHPKVDNFLRYNFTSVRAKIQSIILTDTSQKVRVNKYFITFQVKEGDQDVLDLLRGDSALLDAAKKGNLTRVQKLLTPENINCRDSQGRNSTPLHLAAGYNNLEVAEFLLENGADVNAQDKGGLIPLHNASSYGHLDIAALLIRYRFCHNL